MKPLYSLLAAILCNLFYSNYAMASYAQDLEDLYPGLHTSSESESYSFSQYNPFRDIWGDFKPRNSTDWINWIFSRSQDDYIETYESPENTMGDQLVTFANGMVPWTLFKMARENVLEATGAYLGAEAGSYTGKTLLPASGLLHATGSSLSLMATVKSFQISGKVFDKFAPENSSKCMKYAVQTGTAAATYYFLCPVSQQVATYMAPIIGAYIGSQVGDIVGGYIAIKMHGSDEELIPEEAESTSYITKCIQCKVGDTALDHLLGSYRPRFSTQGLFFGNGMAYSISGFMFDQISASLFFNSRDLAGIYKSYSERKLFSDYIDLRNPIHYIFGSQIVDSLKEQVRQALMARFGHSISFTGNNFENLFVKAVASLDTNPANFIVDSRLQRLEKAQRVERFKKIVQAEKKILGFALTTDPQQTEIIGNFSLGLANRMFEILIQEFHNETINCTNEEIKSFYKVVATAGFDYYKTVIPTLYGYGGFDGIKSGVLDQIEGL